MSGPLKEPKSGRATVPTSVRISPAADYLWRRVALESGISRTVLLEQWIRREADALGIEVPEKLRDVQPTKENTKQ